MVTGSECASLLRQGGSSRPTMPSRASMQQPQFFASLKSSRRPPVSASAPRLSVSGFCCQTEAPCKACAARAPRGHVRSPHVGLGSLHTLPTCQPTAATEKVLVRSISPSRAPQLAADEEARGRRNRRAGLPVALKSRLWRSYHGWSARAPTGLADLLS